MTARRERTPTAPRGAAAAPAAALLAAVALGAGLLGVVLLATWALAGPAAADERALTAAGRAHTAAGLQATAARPARPAALTPRGPVTSARPAFTWTRAARARTYEVRVYRDDRLLARKAGITKRSWRAVKALPSDVALTWRVRARNAAGAGPWSRPASFSVVTPSTAKAITAFSFASPPATGAIDEAAHTISVTVPPGTDLRALVPTIAITGVSVSPPSGVAGDFSAPRVYTVTAQDGSTQAYTVTVRTAILQAEVLITAFAFVPPTLDVDVGTIVTWTNADVAPHTVTSMDSLATSASPTGLFNSGPFGQGQTFSFTFTTPGTYYYACLLHSTVPSMHAQVNVR